MVIESFRIGIMFNGIVCAMVAVSALLLVVYLFSRWSQLSMSSRAIVWVWFATFNVWAWIAIRNIYIGFGYLGEYNNSFIYNSDLITQLFVFLTGPAVFYYVGIRLTKRADVSAMFAFISAVFALFSLRYLAVPGGFFEPTITYFSADSSLNETSMIIFGIQLIIAVFLLSIDAVHQLKQWRLEHDKDSLYSAMYSLAIILYAILGIIDQAKIILDWPLLVFRLSYIGIFLMTYVTTLQHEAFHEQYLIEEKTIS